MLKQIVLFALCLLNLYTPILQAQNVRYPWAITANIGLSEYSGDLGNGLFRFNFYPTKIYTPDHVLIQQNRPGYLGLALNRYLNPRLDLCLQYQHGEWGYINNSKTTYFFRRMDEVDFLLKYKPIAPIANKVQPYLLGGIGYRNISNPGISASYNTFHLPLGFGINVQMSNRVTFNFQSHAGIMNTDNSDGFSGINFAQRDIFWNHSLGISYLFDLPLLHKNLSHCPGFR